MRVNECMIYCKICQISSHHIVLWTAKEILHGFLLSELILCENWNIKTFRHTSVCLNFRTFHDFLGYGNFNFQGFLWFLRTLMCPKPWSDRSTPKDLLVLFLIKSMYIKPRPQATRELPRSPARFFYVAVDVTFQCRSVLVFELPFMCFT